MTYLSREDCERLDREDPLAHFRNEFTLPDGVVYMTGNSLGAMPTKALARAQDVISRQWGVDLIKSWNVNDWFTLTTHIGDQIATTIGADAGEVVMTDSTGINLYKVLSAALTLRPERKKIVMEGSNFPTDNYMAQGLLKQLGSDYEIVFAEGDDITKAIDNSVAVVCLTQVHYKTGRLLDMQAITALTHEAGAISVWDLCHSAGALPVELNACDADFAIGCTYKYYNGGPGSPAFIFVAKRHQGKALQPLTGWWGHKAPFAFERDYTPADDIIQMLSGTQPILTMSVSEIGIEISARADMQQIRNKSLAMGDLMIRLIEEQCGEYGFEVISPKGDLRGSQVAMSHKEGYPIMQALITAGIMGDFRAPDTLRFGITPLYLRYVDLWDAIAELKNIMDTNRWQQAQYNQRHAVT
ncbi:kynureninase [Shewanella eurypsychrophilus]|uniref:Kynureninase n=1 Tax=Shewanella eurypsychrophilus TaxID=2593656 RepID=A0ABX6V3G1_9GAMM|nr:MULTISPECIES: kynureninase [Shewanella]QPG57176.2 kynureninase [Shewanella eurypsychrophilus]